VNFRLYQFVQNKVKVSFKKARKEGVIEFYFFFFLADFFLTDFDADGAGAFFCTVFCT
jgi:hypothetical protein